VKATILSFILCMMSLFAMGKASAVEGLGLDACKDNEIKWYVVYQTDRPNSSSSTDFMFVCGTRESGTTENGIQSLREKIAKVRGLKNFPVVLNVIRLAS